MKVTKSKANTMELVYYTTTLIINYTVKKFKILNTPKIKIFFKKIFQLMTQERHSYQIDYLT